MTLENTPPLSAAGAVGTATTSAADTSVNSAASFFMLTTVLRGSAALHADGPFTPRRSGKTLAAGRFDRGGTMSHRGQVLALKTTGHDGQPLWAYRYRPGGRVTGGEMPSSSTSRNWTTTPAPCCSRSQSAPPRTRRP